MHGQSWGLQQFQLQMGMEEEDIKTETWVMHQLLIFNFTTERAYFCSVLNIM